MRISDWSSDVCSSDLIARQTERLADLGDCTARAVAGDDCGQRRAVAAVGLVDPLDDLLASFVLEVDVDVRRSEEHTSELQSLMRISYAVFCLKKKKHIYSL